MEKTSSSIHNGQSVKNTGKYEEKKTVQDKENHCNITLDESDLVSMMLVDKFGESELPEIDDLSNYLYSESSQYSISPEFSYSLKDITDKEYSYEKKG